MKRINEYLASGTYPPEGEEVLCARPDCDGTFVFTRKAAKRLYCSQQCKERASRERRYRPNIIERECVICGRPFHANHPNKKTCSPTCSVELKRSHDRVRNKVGAVPPEDEEKERLRRQVEASLRRETGRTLILCQLLRDYVESHPPDAVRPYPVRHRARRTPEVVVALRSDYHPGLVTPSYDAEVYLRRVRAHTEALLRVVEVIRESIPLDELVVFDLGDLVTGQGIFPGQAWQTDLHVLEQIYHYAAPAMVSQILTWAENFKKVAIYNVPGNHGRTGIDYPHAANWDNVLAQELSARLERIRNVEVHVSWDWWRVVEVLGWRFLLVHGHQIRSWLNIPFYGLVQKGMRWQGSIPTDWDYLVHGHFHVSLAFPWNNFQIIGNGTLVSDDEFALRELGMSARPSQQVFGLHPEHGVTWRYTLYLD